MFNIFNPSSNASTKGGKMGSKGHGVEELSEFAMEFIKQAGKKAMPFYGKGQTRVKFDQGMVTEADLRIADYFQEKLNERFPDHHLFEYDQLNEKYSHEGKRYLWIFDPIEGVANYQAGIPIWGMSMALLDNFWPILGVFYMPATGDIFHARAGQNAFWGKKKIQISEAPTINDESVLFTFSRFHQYYRSTFPGKMRNLGCASAHICYVAMGRADAAVIANESFQGLAAARVILEAAGGKVCNFDGCDFHLNEYLDGQKIDDHLLVAAPESFAQVRECLKPFR
jgi:myo-inositol-1(or 4)-monophosphatase